MTGAAPLIHVVDDDSSFRRAIGRVLQASGYQVALYESGDELLGQPPGVTPGCILLDLRMTGLNGLELQDRLLKQGYTAPIIFLTGHGDIPASVHAIKAGAEDFLTKPVPKETLLATVERALARDTEQRQQRDQRSRLLALVSSLTPREREVFDLVIRGRLNKQIAFELGTSVRTIKAHRHAIMEKLKVRSVAEAVSIAERLDILKTAAGGGSEPR
jgi:RNA polymerase sigma factor (sigma-70 family)